MKKVKALPINGDMQKARDMDAIQSFEILISMLEKNLIHIDEIDFHRIKPIEKGRVYMGYSIIEIKK